jgi:hypothetical protein
MNMSRRMLHGLLALLGITLILSAQVRDQWLKMERKGTGYGYEHITVTRLPDGNLRYDYDQHIKTDIAGFNPQDITQKGFYIVTADLAPLSLELTTKFQLKETRLTAINEDGTLLFETRDADGQITNKKIPFAEASFDVLLPELIARNVEKKSFRLKFLNPNEGKIDEIAVTILRAGGEEIEAEIAGLVKSIYRLDRTGRVKEIRNIGLDSRAYQTDAADAQNITYLNTADGYTLTVKSEKAFPNVFRVRRARIEVQWQKIPMAEFRWEDNRQKIAEKKESGGLSEVILAIEKPSAPPRQVAAPVGDPRFAEYLGEDEFIQPRDPAIRERAAAIVGEEKDAGEIVRKILSWVNANVASDYIAETLTGPEVLRKRRGKCSEYAILTASLARAAGVPTRIALGELYSNGTWTGHMWDEVWLGEWTAIDAAAGIFVTGPSHLKFIDSPTVTGTQPLRWKLTDNLRIEILDFEEEAETAPKDMTTGIVGRTYSNKTFSSRISSPDDTWTLREETRGGVLTLNMNSQEKGVRFALVFFAVPPATSPKTVLQGRLNALSKMVQEYTLIEESEADIAGRRAPFSVFSQKIRDGSILVNLNAVLIEGTNAYLFAFIAPKDRFESLRPTLKKILDSFEIVK